MQTHFNCTMTVHRQYVKADEIVFEDARPQELLIAVGYQHRKKIYLEAIERGFTPKGCELGKEYFGKHNSIIFELNNIQPYTVIGVNCVLWAGNHIGHHARIGSHCFITSHVCIGGGAVIGDECFIGMNATVFDHVKIGNKCIIAAGAVVDRDIPDNHTLSRKGVLVSNALA